MLGLALGLTLLLATGPANTNDAPDEARAALSFSEGRERFAEEDYDAALAAFRDAYRIAPHDKVRFNIAQCLLELGRAREAFVEFDAIATSPQLSADERALARASAETAAGRLGTLRFTGDAEQTVVVDDGQRCVVPCTLSVDAGRHALEVVDGPPLDPVSIGADETLEVDVPAPLHAAEEPTVPAPRPPPPAQPIEPARADNGPPQKLRPSALTWVGVSLAAVGGAGVVGFGLRAQNLHDTYVSAPQLDTRRQGLTARNLTNASIGIAALGGALLVADLVRLAVLRRRR